VELEMSVIKKEAKEYTPVERLEIVTESLNENSNISELAAKYNISRDTFYSWKNALMGSIDQLWSENHAGRKKADEPTEDVEELKKRLYEAEKQLEIQHLIAFKNNLILKTLPESYKKKFGAQK
jgi:transposase-like protein